MANYCLHSCCDHAPLLSKHGLNAAEILPIAHNGNAPYGTYVSALSRAKAQLSTFNANAYAIKKFKILNSAIIDVDQLAYGYARPAVP